MSERREESEAPSHRRQAGRWRRALRALWQLTALTAAKTRSDDLIQRSAALAFVTIFSLVPLLAAFSYVGAQAFEGQRQKAVDVLGQILPYYEATIVDKLQQFVSHAQEFRDVSFIVFILTALVVFSTIEETVNRIWNVPRRRAFRSRLLSFTMLVFWGPLLIGAAYSALFFLERQTGFRSVVGVLPLQLLPFAVTVLGLSMLYWMVPYTAVRFRSAFAGGLTAALLLEGLQWGFGAYVELYRRFSVIYGSFGLVLLFLVSIQLAWWIVLLGADVAYCLQNFRLLARPRRPAAPLEGAWLGLAALVVVTDRFRRGKPITPHELLAERLRISIRDLPLVLEPLVERRLLEETGGDAEGYLLCCDPYQLRLEEVLNPYEPLHREILERLDGDLASRLQELRDRLRRAREAETRGMTLAELLPRRVDETSPAAGEPDPRAASESSAPELAVPSSRG